MSDALPAEHSAERTVLVGVDGSTSALDAARWAADECARRDLTLTLLHCDTQSAGAGSPAAGDRGDSGPDFLREAAEAVAQLQPDVPVSMVERTGAIVPVLIDESRTAALVVCGSRGLGAVQSALTGSTAVGLSRQAHCPVVVVRSSDEGAVISADAPVLVGTDGSPTSDNALDFAFEAASRRGVQLVVLMSWSDVFLDSDSHLLGLVTDWRAEADDHRRLLAEQLAGRQERYPDVSVERVLVHDRPVRALLKEAAVAQLVVVGSRGRGGFTGMVMGSTSQALVYHCPCPLAIVRPDENTDEFRVH